MYNLHHANVSYLPTFFTFFLVLFCPHINVFLWNCNSDFQKFNKYRRKQFKIRKQVCSEICTRTPLYP